MPPYQSSNVAKLALLAQATERKEQKLGWPLGGFGVSAEYVCNCVCIELYPSFPFFILLLLLIVCVASDGDHVAPDFREHATLGSLFFLRR